MENEKLNLILQKLVADAITENKNCSERKIKQRTSVNKYYRKAMFAASGSPSFSESVRICMEMLLIAKKSDEFSKLWNFSDNLMKNIDSVVFSSLAGSLFFEDMFEPQTRDFEATVTVPPNLINEAVLLFGSWRSAVNAMIFFIDYFYGKDNGWTAIKSCR